MNHGIQFLLATRNAIAFCCLFAAGCAWVTPAPTEGRTATDAVVTTVSADTPSDLTPPIAAPPLVAPLAVETASTPQAGPETIPPAVASQPIAAPRDFTSLGARLRQTKTIGVLTKLAVKNEADDLLDDFRAYHRQQGAATLPEVRRSDDMLLLKVLSLVQDGDPPLAQDSVRSRGTIWEILADPRRFIESNLMAGVAR